jgi:hypothetical protein
MQDCRVPRALAAVAYHTVATGPLCLVQIIAAVIAP